MKRKTLADVLKGLHFIEFAEHENAKTWVLNKHIYTLWVEYSKKDDTVKIMVRSQAKTEYLFDGEFTLASLKQVLEAWIKKHG